MPYEPVREGTFYSEKHGRIVVHHGYSVRIHWSNDMLDYLKQHYSTTLNDELAGCLGVSPRTMIRKARELGLEKNQFGYAVKRVLEITEADRLEDIKGKPVRAKFTGNGSLGDTLIGIGHLLRENWLIPREDSMWNDEIKDDEEE